MCVGECVCTCIALQSITVVIAATVFITVIYLTKAQVENDQPTGYICLGVNIQWADLKSNPRDRITLQVVFGCIE